VHGLCPRGLQLLAEFCSSHSGALVRCCQRSGVQPLSIAVRALLLGILVLLTLEAVREGIAAYYLRQNTPEAIEKAMKWDRADPVYPATAGNLIHLYSESPDPNRVVQLYRRALQLSPFDAGYCADLAEANEWAGRPGIATDYYQQALNLFPNSPEMNWKVANFYIRRGKSEAAYPLLRNALTSRVIPRTQVFALTLSARLDAATVIDEVLPNDPSTIAEYLNFQADHNNSEAAGLTWNRLMRLQSPFEIEKTFHYIDWLVKSHDVDSARRAWESVVLRFPSLIPEPASPENLVTNGDFKARPVNGGFDWLTYPVAGATVTYEVTEEGRNGSLRIDFDGSENLNFNAVAQFVAVEPNRKYELSFRERTVGITTESGVGMQVVDAYDYGKVSGSSAPLVGSVPWEERKLEFETGDNVRLVLLTVLRKKSTKLDGKVAGTAWFSHVSISPTR
jgi:hypothetical protein